MIPALVGIAGIAITVSLHAVATSIIAGLLKRFGPVAVERTGRFARPAMLGGVAICLSIKHYLDIIMWAVAYWFLAGSEHFDGFGSAIYFSSVTYTALGYGDIVLTNSWRMICGAQAMNGILLFGWSTALMFYLVQRLWCDSDDESVTSYAQDHESINR